MSDGLGGHQLKKAWLFLGFRKILVKFSIKFNSNFFRNFLKFYYVNRKNNKIFINF